MADDQQLILYSGIGSAGSQNSIVARGSCPFCTDKVTFRQITYNDPESIIEGRMVAVRCEGCNSILSLSIDTNKLHPSPRIKGILGVPSAIERYYQEGLRCISVDAPNGAATLFRKAIHQLGIHYGVATKNDKKELYEIIKELHAKEHIPGKLKEALLGMKDVGNDGAHVNENEPDLVQAMKLKALLETVLNSTVISDQNLAYIKEKHNSTNT
ncbi:MAG TPA: DUF4145 domain-containing protein [Candidatus Binatia bacterium]|nr:DUF4145 domain-containing protein [Candidatus Binatia bacterium]